MGGSIQLPGKSGYKSRENRYVGQRKNGHVGYDGGEVEPCQLSSEDSRDDALGMLPWSCLRSCSR